MPKSTPPTTDAASQRRRCGGEARATASPATARDREPESIERSDETAHRHRFDRDPAHSPHHTVSASAAIPRAWLFIVLRVRSARAGARAHHIPDATVGEATAREHATRAGSTLVASSAAAQLSSGSTRRRPAAEIDAGPPARASAEARRPGVRSFRRSRRRTRSGRPT